MKDPNLIQSEKSPKLRIHQLTFVILFIFRRISTENPLKNPPKPIDSLDLKKEFLKNFIDSKVQLTINGNSKANTEFEKF